METLEEIYDDTFKKTSSELKDKWEIIISNDANRKEATLYRYPFYEKEFQKKYDCKKVSLPEHFINKFTVEYFNRNLNPKNYKKTLETSRTRFSNDYGHGIWEKTGASGFLELPDEKIIEYCAECNAWCDLRDNWLEIFNHEANIEGAQKESQGNTKPPPSVTYYEFDNRIIETFIFQDKLEAFYNIEKALFDNNYLSSKGKWITLKHRLVAYIHILIKLEYVRPTIKKKSENNSLNHIRHYFENRYLTDISQQIKPSKFDVTKLHTYHPDFKNIIPEIDLIKK